MVVRGPSMCKYPLYYIIVTSWLLHHCAGNGHEGKRTGIKNTIPRRLHGLNLEERKCTVSAFEK